MMDEENDRMAVRQLRNALSNLNNADVCIKRATRLSGEVYGAARGAVAEAMGVLSTTILEMVKYE